MNEIMKAVADVEAVPDIKPHRIPSPRNPRNPKAETKKMSGRAKKGKGLKKGEVDIFHVIGNPVKMSDEPLENPPKNRKAKKGKKKGPKKFKNEYSSDGSFSLSSYGGGSFAGSMASLGSYEDSEFASQYSGSDMGVESSSSFEGRQKFTRKKRKEEIMQEKIEMLTRISNMSRMGFTATKKWSMKDDIDEIRFECYRMTRENNSRKSVKNMQHMLITAATIVEFANSLVNPFNLKLQGFSKNLMLTVSDYDDSLEELHHKWSGRTSVGPEMTVLFTFVTSAIFHHAGNVMSSPGDQPRSGQQSNSRGPDMSSVLGLFSNMMPKTSVPSKPSNNTNNNVEEESCNNSNPNPNPKKRRPMKGPSPSFANLLPSMQVPA